MGKHCYKPCRGTTGRRSLPYVVVVGQALPADALLKRTADEPNEPSAKKNLSLFLNIARNVANNPPGGDTPYCGSVVSPGSPWSY